MSRAAMEALARRAADAAAALRRSTADARTQAIRGMAAAIRDAAGEILAANAEDLRAATGLTAAKRDRLALDAGRVEEMARGLDRVAELADPVGRLEEKRVRPDGLHIARMRVPLGVILMIFEARPNVTAESAALGLRSGNATILKGGSEAARSNAAIGRAVRRAVEAAGLPADAVQLVESPDHEDVLALLEMDRHIDLVIPRGGESLIRAVAERSRIPVLKHYKGNCHVYVDAQADLAMAEEIVMNAKVQRPGTCNATEHLLVHEAVAPEFLPRVAARLRAAGVEIRGDERTRALVPDVRPATDADWGEEYLDLVLGVKVVRDAGEAIAHIERYGSRHTDAIVTRDEATARRFLTEVDSSSVMWNASTRLADGGEYGIGAEIGISTDKLHARGPMGAEELTSVKWVVVGQGHLRGAPPPAR